MMMATAFAGAASPLTVMTYNIRCAGGDRNSEDNNWRARRDDLANQVKRLNPDVGTERLVNLMTAWKREIMELMGGMGINSIEALRGNRLMLRGVGLNEKELAILGVSHAGE